MNIRNHDVDFCRIRLGRLALAAIFPIACCAGLPAEGASFRFASWNIGHFALGSQTKSAIAPEDAEAKAAEYRRMLDDVGADVLGICEYATNFTAAGWSPTERVVFGDYPERAIGQDMGWRWNAHFSKSYPILEREPAVPFNATYPGLHRWLQQTTYAKSVLEIAGRRVVFAQVHLSWEEYRLRRLQMDALIRDLASERYVVIAGDFNVGTDSIGGFAEYLKDHSKVSRNAKSGEYEIFRQAGYTPGNDDRFLTCPAGAAKMPLDNIIVRGLRLRDFRVVDRADLSDHALVAATLEFEDDDRLEQPGVMMRFSSAQTQESREAWKRTARALAEHPGCCDDIWFSTGESFPSLSWHRRHLEILREAAEDVRQMGIRVSLQFEATIGHGDHFPTAAEKALFDKPWTGWTGTDGTECRYCSCPRQPGFLKRLEDVSALYAEIRPAVVWIDDDMRITNHSPVSGKDAPGCWCATCVADFAAEEGRAWTRESLREAYGKDSALRQRWHDFSARSMSRAACVIARAFRKVSPRTRMGFQTASDRMPMTRIIVRAMAGETGEKVGVRIGGGDYYDFVPFDGLKKSIAAVATRKAMDLEDVVDNWCTEVETYPRTYGSRSVRSLALESFAAIAGGLDTTSVFAMDRRSETDETYGRYLLGPLASVTSFIRGYRTASRGTEPAGFTMDIPASDRRRLCGLPILSGLGRSWGVLSGEHEEIGGSGAVWGEFRTDLVPGIEKTPSDKMQLVRDRLSASAPLEVKSPFVGLVFPRVNDHGDLRTIGLVGARLDTQYDIVLRIDTTVTKAVWHELDAGSRTLPIEKIGEQRRVTIPTLGAWNAGYLEL